MPHCPVFIWSAFELLRVITVWCHYNVVNFVKKTQYRHPIALPGWPDMGYLCEGKIGFWAVPDSLQYCLEYLIMLDHVIKASICMWFCWPSVHLIRISAAVIWKQFCFKTLRFRYSVADTCCKWIGSWTVIDIMVCRLLDPKPLVARCMKTFFWRFGSKTIIVYGKIVCKCLQ